MNILLINPYAGSPQHGMEFRPYYLAREWVRMGHRVTIVAASFSHLHQQEPWTAGPCTEEKIDGIRYLWLGTRRYRGNGWQRVLHMVQFAWRLWQWAGTIGRLTKPDLVIASSPHPFSIYGARKIARKWRARLVFEVRDLWPLTLIELGGKSPRHPFVRWMQAAEDTAYREADEIVSLLPKADRYMQERGMAPEKFRCLPNGYAQDEWSASSVFANEAQLPEQHARTLNRLREEGYFVVGYAGQHGVANALEVLLEAASLMHGEPVAFVLVGQGSEKERLQWRAHSMGLTNVFFLPPIAKSAIPSVLSDLDALYIGWKHEPLYRFGVSPNKLLDYMMAAKPIVHSIEAGNDLVQESGCGISVPPEDAQAVAVAIGQLLVMSQAQRDLMGQKGREFVQKHHEYGVLARKFLERTEAALQEQGRRTPARFYFYKGRVALYALLKAFGIGKGDRVLLPGYTCIVVPQAVRFSGATPEYADVEAHSGNASLREYQAAYERMKAQGTSHLLKALLIQHTYGNPNRDTEAIVAWAREKGLRVLEDCAHVNGVTIAGRLAGSFGDGAFFSTQWSKPFTTGLGGIAQLNNLADRGALAEFEAACVAQSAKENGMLALQLFAHALLVRPRLYWFAIRTHRRLAKKGLFVGSSTEGELAGEMPPDYAKRMSGWQRFLLKRRERKMAKRNAHRVWLAAEYDRLLAERDMPVYERETEAVLIRYPVQVSDRAMCLSLAQEARVELGDWFDHPLHPEGSSLEGLLWEDEHCPHAVALAKHTINLPVHERIDAEEAARIVDFITAFRYEKEQESEPSQKLGKSEVAAW